MRCPSELESGKVLLSAMRTHHHFGIRLNPFMFLRTELRSKWSDCEPCEKTHHVKSDLSRATKKLLKFAKTRFEEKPVTVKSWGEGVDAENEALANVVSAWAGVPKEDGQQMIRYRSGIYPTKYEGPLDVVSAITPGRCRSRLGDHTD